MCFRTKLNTKISKIERTFEANFSEPNRYVPQQEINAFDFKATPVIADFSSEEILFFQWGLVPSWAKNDQIKKSTLNARIETATEKPAFKNSVLNRCLVIADGFYEWQWLDPKGRQKQKFLLQPRDQEVFAFAGIYSPWKDPESGNQVYTYSILTTEANELMSSIHNTKRRMPVVLNPHDRLNWLQGTPLEDFAFPYEVPLMANPQ